MPGKVLISILGQLDPYSLSQALATCTTFKSAIEGTHTIDPKSEANLVEKIARGKDCFKFTLKITSLPDIGKFAAYDGIKRETNKSKILRNLLFIIKSAPNNNDLLNSLHVYAINGFNINQAYPYETDKIKCNHITQELHSNLMTPIMFLACANNIKAVKHLLDYCAIDTHEIENVLSFAQKNGSVDLVNMILRKYPNMHKADQKMLTD